VLYGGSGATLSSESPERRPVREHGAWSARGMAPTPD
jgi:hypothetical protein